MKKNGMGKKGLGLNDIWGVVYILGISAVLIGVMFLILGRFGSSLSGVDTNAQLSINQSITALQPISSTWMTIWVTISAVVIILGLVVGGFAFAGARKGGR